MGINISTLITGDSTLWYSFESVILTISLHVFGEASLTTKIADFSFSNLGYSSINHINPINNFSSISRGKLKCIDALKHFSVICLANLSSVRCGCYLELFTSTNKLERF